jgi:hypothetical protein
VSDVFLARYDSAGERLWIRQFGTRATESAQALAPDGAGGVMVTGNTFGSLGGPIAGLSDAFLARYDSAGQRLWIRQFGTNNRDLARALVPDGAGGVMVAGQTLGSLGGPIAGQYDAFLARYDSAGNRLRIRQFGTSSDNYASALAPDGASGVMLAGGPGAYLAWFSGCDGCDMDCDGDIDGFDIEPFLELLFGKGEPCAPCTGDVNADGNIDEFDIEPFLNCLFP